MLIQSMKDVDMLPEDVQDRIQVLLQNKIQAPIYLDSIEQYKAEFINTYSNHYVEVFVLYNNECGAHYFFVKKESNSKEDFLFHFFVELLERVKESFEKGTTDMPLCICDETYNVFTLKSVDSKEPKYLGFGGNIFQFLNKDTEELIECENVWHNGLVPEELRHLYSKYAVYKRI